MSWLWLRVAPEPEKVQDPYRNFLSDNGPILFTHGDLDRSNIIISTTSPARVLGIIDWEQAGWFPEYWEYCKAAYTVGEEEEWRAAGWIDSFLTAYLQEMDAWEFTVESIGGI
jgi:aminoglycoside phosphotransferase (APT) family kinase protein